MCVLFRRRSRLGKVMPEVSFKRSLRAEGEAKASRADEVITQAMKTLASSTPDGGAVICSAAVEI